MEKETEIEKRARQIGSEPAFPTSSLEGAFGDRGLTKLEFAAIKIMQGFCSQPEIPPLPSVGVMCKNAVIHAKSLFHALAEMEVNNG